MVFSDGEVESWIEQTSFSRFRVVENVKKGGRPRLTHVTRDTIADDYRWVLRDLRAIRALLNAGKLLLSETDDISAVLRDHMGPTANNLATSGGRLAVRTHTGSLREIRRPTLSSFCAGDFTPYELAGQILAHLNECSVQTIRGRLRATQKSAQ
jgi:hypothetical protein